MDDLLGELDLLTPSPPEESRSRRRLYRPRAPRKSYTKDEVKSMKLFLLALELHPNFWDRTTKVKGSLKEWKQVARHVGLKVKDGKEAKSMYDKVYTAIVYRVKKANKDGKVTREMWLADPENAFQRLCSVQAYEFWEYAKYLTKKVVNQCLKVRLENDFHISSLERHRLWSELMGLGCTSGEGGDLGRNTRGRTRDAQADPNNTPGPSGSGQNLVLLSSVKEEEEDEDLVAPMSMPRFEVWAAKTASAKQVQGQQQPRQQDSDLVLSGRPRRAATEKGQTQTYNIFNHVILNLRDQEPELQNQAVQDEAEEEQEQMQAEEAKSPLEFYLNFKKAQEKENGQAFTGPLPSPSEFPKVPEKFNVEQEDFERMCRAFDELSLKMWSKMQQQKNYQDLEMLKLNMMMLFRSANELKKVHVQETDIKLMLRSRVF